MLDEPITEPHTSSVSELDGISVEWSFYLPLIRNIEQRHAEFDDAETPRLPESVVHGTRRLICWLYIHGENLPTVMTGTCDATIVLEWHDAEGDQVFRSFDVLSDDTAEEYIKFTNGKSVLRTVEF